jgi:hypothetical protein
MKQLWMKGYGGKIDLGWTVWGSGVLVLFSPNFGCLTWPIGCGAEGRSYEAGVLGPEYSVHVNQMA